MGQLAPREIIAILNSLSLSEVSAVEGELARARDALAGLGHVELSEGCEKARRHLHDGKVSEFRRMVANVTAKLGHLK